tara:strand:+ start:12805 stop:13446 length:642 start_codon:yes stop_codon:yes gene_type:complete
VIIIDSREKGIGQLITYFATHGIQHTTQKLDYCDYEIHYDGGVVGIERKRTGDFLQSLPRLDAKFYHMQDEYDVSCLIIEGKFHFDKNSGFIYEYRGKQRTYTHHRMRDVHRWLFSFQIKGGLVIYTKDKWETATALASLEKYILQGLAPTWRITAKDCTAEEWAQFMLTCIENVGPALAKKIVETATSVKGVGPKRAKGIIRELDSHEESDR